MGTSSNYRFLWTEIVFLCLLLCIATIPAIAAEAAPVSDTPDLMPASAGLTTEESSSFQLIRERHDAGLNFDLGGSDTTKLQLQLVQPLTLSARSRGYLLDNGANQLGLDATLDVPLGNNFSLTTGANQQLAKAQFHSLGSIHCINGILRPDSYTASGCQFVNESNATSQSGQITLGARYDTDNASASIKWFTHNADVGNTGGRQLNMSRGVPVASDSLLIPGLGDPLLGPSTNVDPLQQFMGQATGVDLDFRVGIATDNKGDIRLGLSFSHVLDADYQGIYSNSQNPLSWTLAESFNSARINLEWNRGNFSSGIRGFYREPVNFLNRNSIESLTTFDVHFTWKTPWNANLSVGTTNILNAGSEPFSTTREANKVEMQPNDPLESVYGRIPYVRYQQDL